MMIAGRRLPAFFSVQGLLLLNFQGVNSFVRGSLTTHCLPAPFFFRSPMSPGFLYHQQYQPLRSLPKAVRKVLALFVDHFEALCCSVFAVQIDPRKYFEDFGSIPKESYGMKSECSGQPPNQLKTKIDTALSFMADTGKVLFPSFCGTEAFQQKLRRIPGSKPARIVNLDEG